MTAHDVTALAHEWIAPVLCAGRMAVDATAGSGRDTLYLARAVGPAGRVHAFDIQRRALAQARSRLAAAGPAARVHWHLACHSRAARRIGPARPDAVMFNLGWLPDADHDIVTYPKTTVAALDALAGRLRVGGRLSVVAYRGHAGGSEEATAVARWFARGGRIARPLIRCAASPSPRAPVLHVAERI